MTKWKKQKKVVGTKDATQRWISKPLFNLIVDYQKELQDKEDNKNKKKGKKYKPRKISFLYASLELSRRIKK